MTTVDEFSVFKTFESDLINGDFRARSTDLQCPREPEPQRELDIHFSPSGERFLDYLAFQAGLIPLADYIAPSELMLKTKKQERLERMLLRPEQSIFQFLVRHLIRPRSIYTVETLNAVASPPAVYEVNRYPDELYLSLGPLSFSMVTDWLLASDDVAFVNMILMQEQVNQKLPQDVVPFFWLQPGTTMNKLKQPREKLRITTSRRGFKSVAVDNVRKRKEIVLAPEETSQGSSRCPWVMLSVFESLNYQRAMAYFRFVPFLELKFLIFLQASITVFFILGLSSTILRLAQEAVRDVRLNFDVFGNFGFWCGLLGVGYFVKLVVCQWSFGAAQDHWLIILLVFGSNIAYLAAIKLLLPQPESQSHLKLKLGMICLLYATYTLTYAISYPWLTFVVYEAAAFKFVLKDFLEDQSRIFSRSL